MKHKLHKTYLWEEMAYLTRYAGTGLINTSIGFVVIFSAMALGFSPVSSNIAGYAVGFNISFMLSKKFVFRSNGHFIMESVRYLISFITSFLFNLLMLHLALAYLGLHAVTSQILATISYTLLMYMLTRFYVFNTKKSDKLS